MNDGSGSKTPVLLSIHVPSAVGWNYPTWSGHVCGSGSRSVRIGFFAGSASKACWSDFGSVPYPFQPNVKQTLLFSENLNMPIPSVQNIENYETLSVTIIYTIAGTCKCNTVRYRVPVPTCMRGRWVSLLSTAMARSRSEKARPPTPSSWIPNSWAELTSFLINHRQYRCKGRGSAFASVMDPKNQRCGSRMFILDPGSIFPSQIPNPHQRI
jgi:hypothetical protein